MRVPARAHQAPIKMTVPGPFTMAQQAQNDHYPTEEAAAMDYAVGGERGDPRSLRGRRRHRADRRAVHAGAAGEGAPVRTEERSIARSRASTGDDRGAHLLRLRRDHPRAAIRLLVPARARRLHVPADLDRDRASRSSTARCSRSSPASRSWSAASISHDLTVETPDAIVARIRRALRYVRAGERHPRARLRDEVPAARRRLRQAAGDGRGRAPPAHGVRFPRRSTMSDIKSLVSSAEWQQRVDPRGLLPARRALRLGRPRSSPTSRRACPAPSTTSSSTRTG